MQKEVLWLIPLLIPCKRSNNRSKFETKFLKYILKIASAGLSYQQLSLVTV
jgi:hypothetical protein